MPVQQSRAEASSLGDRRSTRRSGSRRSASTIGNRVARILALPAVVVLLLLAVVAADQVADYRSSRSTARSVQLALAVQDLVAELQTERGVTAGVLGGNASFRGEVRPARQNVDEQRDSVIRLVRGGGAVEARVAAAVRQLDGLPAIREASSASGAARSTTFQYYTDRISALSEVDVGLDNVADQELRRGVATLQALQDLTEATSQERAFLNGVFAAGGFADGEFVQLAGMRAAREVALDRFRQFATTEQKAAGDFVFDTGAARITDDFEQVALDAADGRRIVVNPQSWWSGLTTVLDDLGQLQQHVGSQIQVRARELQLESSLRIAGLVAIVALCFAGSIYLAALASRSITRPLAALAAEANSVATERLPQAVSSVQAADADAPPESPPPVQVPARATQEIRSVAAAVDGLQAAAYGLALEQAVQRRDTIESLANLGRRNQSLIRRQLGFITALEREEIDPASLANLFELDHLATRMRRNAASLLALAGASSPRQWSASITVANVIRAAVSEVEDYRRVTLRRVDDASVTGSAIGSVVHLLSELIENGLTFSPPDTEVEIQGRRTPAGYLIAITDNGIGMSAESLAEANARLRGEGDFIAAPTRFIGHFVVGKLARDTSVGVELLPSPVTGLTARVTLPASLLSSSPSVRVIDSSAGPRHSAPPEAAAPQLSSGQLAISQAEQPRSASAVQADLPHSRGPVTRAPVDLDETPPAGLRMPGPARTRPPVARPTAPMPPSVRTDPGNGRQAPRPSPPVDSGTDTTRTRNGLEKRTPRSRQPAAPASGSRKVIDLTSPATRSPVVNDSPAQVSARMMALRNGLQRGKGVQVVAPSAGRDGLDEREVEPE